MTLFDSALLGIVEGFTEFLPVSSTAHLILAAQALGIDQSNFLKTFEIAIQSGAMVAVIAVYWKRFLDIGILKKLLAAFIPTAVIGLVLYKVVKTYLIGDMSIILWALAMGGIALILFEMLSNKETENSVVAPAEEIRALSYKKAALIGVAQSVAIVPGVSRSAATIIGGSLLGMSRAAVVEFSFLLAVPTILAATALDVLKNISAFTPDQTGSLAIGGIAAFITALVGIKFLLALLGRKSFTGFGIYRIVLVVVCLFLFA